MAEFIKSLEKWTWDPDGASPLVLLDFDERMLAVPTFPQQHQVQPKIRLRSDWRGSWDRGGVNFTRTFSRVSDHASPQAMLNYLYAHSLVIAGLRHGTLEVEIKDGDTNRLLDVSIESAVPDYGPKLGHGARVAFTYNITHGELEPQP